MALSSPGDRLMGIGEAPFFFLTFSLIHGYVEMCFFFFLIYLLFIFGCVGSSFLCEGFL